jgi:hypothetical protein
MGSTQSWNLVLESWAEREREVYRLVQVHWNEMRRLWLPR